LQTSSSMAFDSQCSLLRPVADHWDDISRCPSLETLASQVIRVSPWTEPRGVVRGGAPLRAGSAGIMKFSALGPHRLERCRHPPDRPDRSVCDTCNPLFWHIVRALISPETRTLRVGNRTRWAGPHATVLSRLLLLQSSGIIGCAPGADVQFIQGGVPGGSLHLSHRFVGPMHRATRRSRADRRPAASNSPNSWRKDQRGAIE